MPATLPARPRPSKGLWFPLALTFLLLLALPGYVLLVLSLFGLEPATNAWLQEGASLSYHNTLPTWATIFLLNIPPFLLLLYFLKLRRKPVEVPSTYLWRKSIDDLHVNSLFQWLRDNVLLLIQLGIVLLLIYSCLAFQVHGVAASGGKHYILIIDSSASMAVTDVAPSRLEAAKQAALDEIDGRADDDTGMVIEFNSRAAILQNYTRDKALLRAAVRRISQTQRPTRIDQALELADSLANPTRSSDDAAVRPPGENPAEARTYVSPDGIAAEVHLYSDGRFPEVPNFAAGNLVLNYHRMGAAGPESVNNVGIVTFNAVRDEKVASKLQVFIRVLNYRKEPADVTLELEWRQAGQDDLRRKEQAVALRARMLEPGDPEKKTAGRDTPGEGAVTFEVDADEGQDVVLHARLKGHRDQFALDDEAWLVAGVVRKARVLIVTSGNEVLSKFFDQQETAKVAVVRYIKPSELGDEEKYRRPARAGELDLVIFDRCAPAKVEDMPLANTYFIDSVPPPWKRAAMKPLGRPLIRNPVSTHPLMRYLTGLEEILILGGAFEFDLRGGEGKEAVSLVPARDRLLEVDGERAVLFVLPGGRRKVPGDPKSEADTARVAYQDLVMTFPFVSDAGDWMTTWNLKLSLPVFLSNVLYVLGNVSDSAADENVSPGETKVLRPEKVVPRVEVQGPRDDRPRPVPRGGGSEVAYSQTEQVGVYRATWDGGGRLFAVNLLDAEESNTQPRDEIKLGEQQVEAGEGRPRKQAHETWKWVALGALALLLLEWAMYHRRNWW